MAKAKYQTFRQLLEQFGKVAVESAKKRLAEEADKLVSETKGTASFVDRTGNLRKSVHSESRRNGLRQVIMVDAKTKDGTPYGWFVEAYNPFLFPVVNAHRKNIAEIAKQALKDGADNV